MHDAEPRRLLRRCPPRNEGARYAADASARGGKAGRDDRAVVPIVTLEHLTEWVRPGPSWTGPIHAPHHAMLFPVPIQPQGAGDGPVEGFPGFRLRQPIVEPAAIWDEYVPARQRAWVKSQFCFHPDPDLLMINGSIEELRRITKLGFKAAAVRPCFWNGRLGRGLRRVRKKGFDPPYPLAPLPTRQSERSLGFLVVSVQIG